MPLFSNIFQLKLHRVSVTSADISTAIKHIKKQEYSLHMQGNAIRSSANPLTTLK